MYWKYSEISLLYGKSMGILVCMIICVLAFIFIIKVIKIEKAFDRTWDGVIIKKTGELYYNVTQDELKETHHQQKFDSLNKGMGQGDDERIVVKFHILDDSGKMRYYYMYTDTEPVTYFREGDRIRHHGGLLYFEKAEKSKDKYIVCNICGRRQELSKDTCYLCGYNLLK